MLILSMKVFLLLRLIYIYALVIRRLDGFNQRTATITSRAAGKANEFIRWMKGGFLVCICVCYML